jgi:hypothetical protein
MNDVAVPDAVDAVVGWRAWAIARVDGRFRLRSVVAPTLWHPYQSVEATCLRPGRRLFRRWNVQHEAPSAGCECGVYATDPVTAASYASGHADGSERRVLGRVALWGLVAECERGWRASSAYPCQIVIPEHRFGDDPAMPFEVLAFDLAEYGVPVTIADEAELEELMRESYPAGR